MLLPCEDSTPHLRPPLLFFRSLLINAISFFFNWAARQHYAYHLSYKMNEVVISIWAGNYSSGVLSHLHNGCKFILCESPTIIPSYSHGQKGEAGRQAELKLPLLTDGFNNHVDGSNCRDRHQHIFLLTTNKFGAMCQIEYKNCKFKIFTARFSIGSHNNSLAEHLDRCETPSNTFVL